ncbi:MAG: glycosyltransferase family 39 protein [Vicinamibacterales bacterium]
MPDLTRPAAWSILSAAWLAAAIVINPLGDFPLNDDWAYGRVVESLYRLGHLQFPGEVAVSLVAQSIWGLLFVKTLGFSFTVLRSSTLVAGLAGVILVYELFVALRLAPATRWLGTVCTGFTPLYVNLSYTFMTDVFFFTASVGALVFFVRFWQTGREHAFWIAVGFSLVAVFTRDAGMVVPAAFAVACTRRRRREVGLASWRRWVPLLLCGGALVVYQQWLAATDRLPIAYGIHAQHLRHDHVADLVRKALTAGRAILCYVGLLLFPLLLPIAAGRMGETSPRDRTRALALGAAVATMLLAATLVQRTVLPMYVGNILSRASLGPVVIPMAVESLGRASRLFWVPVTLISIVGGALQVMIAPDAVAAFRRHDDPARTMTMAAAAMYVGGLLVTEVLDRYFLLILPLAVVFLGGLTPRVPSWTRAASAVVLGAMVALGVAGTHDYLAWNRARWALARGFIAGARPDRLDGGLEVDAWFAYPLERPFVSDRSWWWVARKPYLITLRPLPRHELISREPTHTWLPFGDGSIYLLRRE